MIGEIISEKNLLNPDGTIDLYHATTKENAKKILSEGILRRPAHMPDKYGIYLSTSPKITEDYGDGTTLLRVRVPASDLRLDETFTEIDRAQSGRTDFVIPTSKGKYVPLSILLVEVELPQLPEGMDRIAVKWDDRIYSVKPGEGGIASHEGLTMANDIPYDEVIAGFINKKGEFVYQYPDLERS